MSRWKNIVLCGGVALLVAFIWLGVRVHFYIKTVVRNAYCSEWTASLVIKHLEANEEQWPDGWDALKLIYDRRAEAYPEGIWSFGELMDRVHLASSVDVEAVRRMATPLNDLITLRDGRRDYWAGMEPNRMIWESLQRGDSWVDTDPDPQ